jgi:uncharacterized protein (DUF2141 family)
MGSFKRAATTVLLAGLGVAAMGARTEQPKCTLRVEIARFRSDRGSARVAIGSSDDRFPADAGKAARRFRVPIVDGQARLTISELPAGEWAIAAFHDENDDGRIDLNLFGIPKEGRGVSRDAKGRLGPPSFEAASLSVAPGASRTTLRIFYC